MDRGRTPDAPRSLRASDQSPFLLSHQADPFSPDRLALCLKRHGALVIPKARSDVVLFSPLLSDTIMWVVLQIWIRPFFS